MGSDSFQWPAWARREPSRPPIFREQEVDFCNLTANPLLEGFLGSAEKDEKVHPYFNESRTNGKRTKGEEEQKRRERREETIRWS
jgi:hypothetical protein